MMEEERKIGSYRQAKDGGREGDGKRNREMQRELCLGRKS